MYFLRAIRPIAEDFLSTIVFIAIYEITGDVRIGIGIGIVTGIGQVAYQYFRKKPIDLMNWASLFLVIVLGTASLVTADPRFVMLKPTIGGAAIGCVMLRPHWMTRYLPQIVRDNVSQTALLIWGYVWSALIFALSGANLYVAFVYGLKVWTWYASIVPLGAQLALFLVQYASLRFVVRRRVRASRAQALPGGNTAASAR